MIRIIGAITLDRAIGVYETKKGRLPWEQDEAKGDLAYFKELTKHQSIIMGRKTFESIDNKSLPERKNFVISSQGVSNPKEEHFVERSIGAAIDVSTGLWPSKDIWIIGGERIFSEGMRFADEILLTVIPIKAYERFDTDKLVYFPSITNNFERVSVSQHPMSNLLRIIRYERRGGHNVRQSNSTKR